MLVVNVHLGARNNDANDDEEEEGRGSKGSVGEGNRRGDEEGRMRAEQQTQQQQQPNYQIEPRASEQFPRARMQSMLERTLTGNDYVHTLKTLTCMF